MAGIASKVILQVSYPESGDASYKTMAFDPDFTVEKCRDLAAKKGMIPEDKRDGFGLYDASSSRWMKLTDKLSTYQLQNRSTIEFKSLPVEHTVYFEGKSLTPKINYSQTVGEICVAIAEQLGNKNEEFQLFAGTDGDTQKGTLLDHKKPLSDQAKGGSTNLILKRKKGLFKNKSRASMAIPQSLEARKVFGQPLTAISNENVYGGIPAVVEKTIAYLENHLDLEGIFRISGNQLDVNAMKSAFDDAKDVDVSITSSPHNCAGLLKLFLRELPEPLFTFDLYDAFIAVYQTVSNPEAKVLYYKVLIDALPRANQLVLYRLLPFLAKVIENEAVNKMAIHNVATVFGPNMLRSPDDSAMTLIQDTAAVNAITCDLLKNTEIIVGEAEHDFIAIGRATFTYTGQTESELSFTTGDIVFVVKEDETGWWEGEIDGQYGFFPTNYVKIFVHLPEPKQLNSQEEAEVIEVKPVEVTQINEPAPASAVPKQVPGLAKQNSAQMAGLAAAAAAKQQQQQQQRELQQQEKPVAPAKPVQTPKPTPAPAPAPAQQPPQQQPVQTHTPPPQAAQSPSPSPTPTVDPNAATIRKPGGSQRGPRPVGAGGPGAGPGGPGMSKKQFMSELDDMKKLVLEEREARKDLESLVKVMSTELRQLKLKLAETNTQLAKVGSAPSSSSPAPAASSGPAQIPEELLNDVEELKSDSMVLQVEVEELQKAKKDLQRAMGDVKIMAEKALREVESIRGGDEEELPPGVPSTAPPTRGRGRPQMPRGRGAPPRGGGTPRGAPRGN